MSLPFWKDNLLESANSEVRRTDIHTLTKFPFIAKKNSGYLLRE